MTEYETLVLHRLDAQDKRLGSIENTQDTLLQAVASLKAQARIWGAGVALVATIVAKVVIG